LAQCLAKLLIDHCSKHIGWSAAGCNKSIEEQNNVVNR
jgi:hypothetical protein